MHTKYTAHSKCSRPIVAILCGSFLLFTAACSRLTTRYRVQSTSRQIAEPSDHPEDDLNAELFSAVGRNDTNEINNLVVLPEVDVNKRMEDGSTLLIWAVQNGCLDAVKALLRVPYISVNAVDNQGKAAIDYAMCLDNLEMVDALDAHPYLDGNRFLSAILRRLDELKQNNPKPEGTEDDLNAELFSAVGRNDTNEINNLVVLPEVDVNKRMEDGSTLLIWAVKNGFLGAVKALLSVPHISVNAVDNQGKAAIDYAMCLDNLEMAEALGVCPDLDVNRFLSAALSRLEELKQDNLNLKEQKRSSHLLTLAHDRDPAPR